MLTRLTRLTTGAPSVLALTVVAAAALLVVSLAGLHTEQRSVDRATRLRHTQFALRGTRATLTAARSEVASLTKERDGLKEELERTKTSLSDVQRSVDLQGGQLEVLKACLSAIEAVGQAFDRGDNAAVQQEIPDVNRKCDEAERIL